MKISIWLSTQYTYLCNVYHITFTIKLMMRMMTLLSGSGENIIHFYTIYSSNTLEQREINIKICDRQFVFWLRFLRLINTSIKYNICMYTIGIGGLYIQEFCNGCISHSCSLYLKKQKYVHISNRLMNFCPKVYDTLMPVP